MDLLNTLVDKGLRRVPPTREEALAVLSTSDDDLLEVVAAAGKVRRRWFGRRVKLNYLVNLKSGLCPEDCSYCSQRLGSKTGILKYTWLKPEEASKAAAAGVAGGAKRVCLVASGRGPTDRDVDRVSQTIAAIKEENQDVEICACLGLLSDGQAHKLRAAGVHAYNHNLNTSEATYGDIATTHTFEDRVQTVRQAQASGLSSCSGLIAGMGESDADLVDVVFALRELDVDSVPVNFLIPFEGTPLAKEWNLTPQRALRILAMVRFVCPDIEVRLAGGREVHLRTLQPLALHLANSIFLGDYLTSEGQAGQDDLAMIADAGFEVEGRGTTTLPPHRADARAAGGCGGGRGDGEDHGGCGDHGGEQSCPPCGSGAQGAGTRTGDGEDTATAPVPRSVPSEEARTKLVTVRRRGAGTELPPNA
ncbi:biotin synthase BioB [Streptomyces sp. MST-110588]|uniref:biotin synthase BioB n=1 Tax=Streptomyces sp. MST-110588 TaxID=2833628 RepID=UPI001F5DCA1C|nr:biotin synthase BioB [Streptomyces sp. MST-110588]UNO38614.1 biotin synthase BioB [Streptomyces sp. MST-110588]